MLHLPGRSFQREKKKAFRCGWAALKHTHKPKQPTGGDADEEGEMFSRSRLSPFPPSPPMLTSRHRPCERSCGYEPPSFSFPLTGEVTTVLSHTHLNPPPPRRALHLPAKCVRRLCPPGGEREGSTSCVKLPLTFLTLSLKPPRRVYFPLFLFIYRGLCLPLDAQNSDS